MSFEKLVEEKIREAMAEGEFDNLPGKGKPINLDAYFATPEDLRIRLDLGRCSDEEERARIKRGIEALVLKMNLIAEYYKRKR